MAAGDAVFATAAADVSLAAQRRDQAAHKGHRDLPNDASVLRLVTAVVIETHDEWAVAECRCLSAESMAKLYAEPAADTAPEELPLPVTT